MSMRSFPRLIPAPSRTPTSVGARSRVAALVVALLALVALAVPAVISAAVPPGGVSAPHVAPGSLPGKTGEHTHVRFNDRVEMAHDYPGHLNRSRNTGGPDKPDDITANNWTSLYPRLIDVDAVSSTEAWAAGEYGHLAHFTGGSWAAIDPPNMRGLDLTSIDMLSQTGGWVAAGSKAFLYDGATWTERSAGLNSSLHVDRISALGPDDVWGISSYNYSCYDQPCTPTIVHWNGTTWSDQYPAHTIYPFDIAMLSANDGWALALNFANPVLLHYNGTTWTNIPIPDGDLSYTPSMSVTPSGEVWITDAGYGTIGAEGAIRRYSNGVWTTWLTPDQYIPGDIAMLSASQGWAVTENSVLGWDGASWTVGYAGRHLTGVCAVSGQVWAVGFADSVLSRSGSSAWTLQRGGPTTAFMWSASALNANDIWAVGGNFLVRGDRTIREAVVLHYTGTWQLVPATLTDTILYDVKMLSPTEGYAVGANMIARWDGTNWSQVAAPNVIMHGLYMLGSGEGWAVGFSGEIWRDHNGVWSQAASPTTRNLWAVAMDSASHGWAVGGSLAGYSVLLEYDGTNWVDRTSTLPPGNPIPRGIYLAPGGEGWIVGGTLPNEGRHPILHLQDGAWSVVPYDDTTYLYRVQPEALGEYWAVGENAHHYVGGSWHRADLPTRFIVYAFALIAGRGGWVLGSDGNIVRYEALAPGQRFYDVLLDNTFYTYIEYMASHGIVSGYSEDNTFRWGNNTTRAQLSKIMVLAEGWTIDTSGGPHFSDVPQSHPFYGYIETAYNHGIISGYTDGTFRPYNNVTRTQLSKIVVLAEGWAIDTSGGPHFRDVSQSNPFYGYVETAYNHSIISGYGCGPGCLEFRPGNDATRGQICKIVYLAVTQP